MHLSHLEVFHFKLVSRLPYLTSNVLEIWLTYSLHSEHAMWQRISRKLSTRNKFQKSWTKQLYLKCNKYNSSQNKMLLYVKLSFNTWNSICILLINVKTCSYLQAYSWNHAMHLQWLKPLSPDFLWKKGKNSSKYFYMKHRCNKCNSRFN